MEAWGVADSVPVILRALDAVQTSNISRPRLVQMRMIRARPHSIARSYIQISLQRIRAQFIQFYVATYPMLERNNCISSSPTFRTTINAKGVVVSTKARLSNSTEAGSKGHLIRAHNLAVCMSSVDACMHCDEACCGLNENSSASAIVWKLRCGLTNYTWSRPSRRVATIRCAVADIFFCGRHDFPQVFALLSCSWGKECFFAQ